MVYHRLQLLWNVTPLSCSVVPRCHSSGRLSRAVYPPLSIAMEGYGYGHIYIPPQHIAIVTPTHVV